MTDPTAIHQWVREFNWDDDLAPMWPIVESSDTDFATALLIYWRLEGPWIHRSGSDSEAVRLHDAVESRLLTGAYARHSLHYDPIADNSLSRVQVEKLKRAGFPMRLLQPDHMAEPDAASNSRPPCQLPSSSEVQTSDSQRTPSSDGCRRAIR